MEAEKRLEHMNCLSSCGQKVRKSENYKVYKVCSDLFLHDGFGLPRTRQKKENHKDAIGRSIVTLSGPCDALFCDWSFS